MKYIRNLILKSLRETLSREEQSALEEEFRQQSSLMDERKQLQQLLFTWQNRRPKPSGLFVDQVIEKINHLKEVTSIWISIGNTFPRVAAALVLLLMGLCLHLYLNTGDLSTDALIGIQMQVMTPEEAIAVLND